MQQHPQSGDSQLELLLTWRETQAVDTLKILPSLAQACQFNPPTHLRIGDDTEAGMVIDTEAGKKVGNIPHKCFVAKAENE